MKRTASKVGIILLVLGVVVLAVAFLGTNGLAALSNSVGSALVGHTVVCNANVDSSILGKLRVNNAVCTGGGSCLVTPGLSILGTITGTDVNGQVTLAYGTSTYASQSITQNILLPGTNYQLSACMNTQASPVMIRAINSQGGKDDEKSVNVQ